MKGWCWVLIASSFAGLMACSGASEPSSSSSDEALSSAQQCAKSCNEQYTACDIGDGCGCYDIYLSCMKRCHVAPGFSPPEGCDAAATPPPPPPPPPPPEDAGACPVDTIYCPCGEGAGGERCMSCGVCNAKCNGVGPSCQ